MTASLRRLSPFARIVVAVVVLAMVGLALGGVRADDRRLAAVFPSTISLYEGAKVKVLGVAVGQVESIEVRGSSVHVEMTYDPEVTLPADVHAFVVPPSIVGDRFVQLGPAYTGGPRLADRATLPLERTSVPLELDDTYRGLDELATALGPQGVNADGALSRFVSASAAAVGGNGRAFNRTVRDFAAALDTLAEGRDDFHGSVRNLGRLTRTLARDDGAVRALVTNLALVSAELEGQRGDLDRATRDLSGALAAVTRFTRKNRAAITGNIEGLRDVTATLARHTGELESLTELAPVGLTGLFNIYVPRNWDPLNPEGSVPEGRTGSLALRAALLNDLGVQLSFTLQTVCTSLPPAQAAQLAAFCTALERAGGDLGTVVSQAAEQGTDYSPGAGFPLAPVLKGRTR